MQGRFQNHYHRLRAVLLRVSSELAIGIDRVLEPFDLTQPQLNILRIIRGAGEPLTVSQIRERIVDRRADVSRLVDRLVGHGLLEKCVNQADRRLVDITLSEQGQELLRQIDERMGEIDALLHVYTEAEAEALARELARLLK